MATNFPSSLDTLTNPTPTTSMSGSLSHAGQHSDLNDAVEALQAKVGADSSAVTTSLDYKVADHASRLTTLEGASGGKILQVVSTNTTAVWSASLAATTTSSLVTGLTATITPSDTSSKILVMLTLHGHLNQWGWQNVFLMRDSTHIGGGVAVSNMPSMTFGATGSGGYGASYGGVHNLNGHYLDSPSTTSAITYGIKLYNAYGATATLAINECYYYDTVNSPRYSSSITVMEVAA